MAKPEFRKATSAPKTQEEANALWNEMLLLRNQIARIKLRHCRQMVALLTEQTDKLAPLVHKASRGRETEGGKTIVSDLETKEMKLQARLHDSIKPLSEQYEMRRKALKSSGFKVS